MVRKATDLEQGANGTFLSGHKHDGNAEFGGK